MSAHLRPRRITRRQVLTGAALAPMAALGIAGAGGWRVALMAPGQVGDVRAAMTAAPATAVVVAPLEEVPAATTTPAPELRLVIARYGFDRPVLPADEPGAVAAGPAWLPWTPAPGAAGRSVVAVPFDMSGLRPLDELQLAGRTWQVIRVGRLAPHEQLVTPATDRTELALYQSNDADPEGPLFAIARQMEESTDG
jgi:hypothetical protein